MRWLVVVALLCVASAHALESQTVKDVQSVLASVDTLLAELGSKVSVSTRTVRDHLEAELEAENAAAQAAQGLPETISSVLASSSLDQAMQAMTRADSKQNNTNSSESSSVNPYPANGLQGTEPVTKFNDPTSAPSAWVNVVKQLSNVAEEHQRRRHHHHHPLRQYAAEYNAAVMNSHAAELSAALKKVAVEKAQREQFDAARSFSQAASQISALASQEQRKIESSSGPSFESTPVISKSSSSSSGSGSSSSSSSGSSSGSGSGSQSLQALQDQLLALLSKRAFATREEQEDLDIEIRKLVVKVIKAKGGKTPVNHHLDLLFNLVKKVRNSFDGLRGLNANEIEDLATQVRAFLMLVEKRQGELLDEKDQAIFCGKRLQEHCSEQRNHCIGACVVKRAVRGNTPVETISCPWNAYQKCTTTFDSCVQKQNSVCGVLGAASGSSSGSFKSESSKKKKSSESSKASSSSASASVSSKASESSGSKKSESSGSKKKKGSESTSKKELDRLDGMEVTDLKKAAAKDAVACKKKLAATCAEARLKCQKSCKSQTNEFYEFCDNDRCKRENEQCHKVNEKVCSGKLVVADVVERLPRAPNCEDSEDIECGTRRMPVTPITVDSHASFSPADDSRHSVSSCDSCQARRAICRTQCQLNRLNNAPCVRNQCQAEQERCDRTCKPSVVAMDPALAVLPIQSTRSRSNVNCPSDAPYCHVKPLHVPRGYLPHRYF